MNRASPESMRCPRAGWQGLLVLAIAVSFLAGCTQTEKIARVDRLSAAGPIPKVLLMQPDITIQLLTASGLPETQAEWTRTARTNFLDALDHYGRTRRIEFVRLPQDAVPGEGELAYERLHAAVGGTILTYYYGPQKLPAKAGGFDWSLGPGVSVIKDRYGTDYALFTFYRDTKATGGRMAMAVLFGAVAGIAIPMGGQGGFASLVDLTTGDIVWFNVVQAGVGDLRSSEGSQLVAQTLLSGLPER